MTQDLKPLMDRATDRPTPFVPDLDQLLAGGRRRARTHLFAGLATTVAAVAVAATAGTFLLIHGGDPAPSVLPAPPPVAGQSSQAAKPKMEKACWNEAGAKLPKSTESWPAAVSARDKFGASAVRYSKGQLAFCNEYTVGARLGTRSPQLPNTSQWFVLPCRYKVDPPCDINRVFMGKLPAKAVRVTVTSDTGQPVNATIRWGFFVVRGGPYKIGYEHPVIARMYDAAGKQLGQYRL